MKILTWTFLFLFSSTIAMTQSSNYLSDFQKKWKNAADYTLELAESMPAEAYNFKPTDDTRTFSEQLLHMVGNMTWLSSSYLGGKGFDTDLKADEYTKEEVLAILREGFAYSTATVAELKAADLEEIVDFFAGPMNKRQILNLMTDHLTHHRGQAIVYLRLNGIKPPRYRGW